MLLTAVLMPAAEGGFTALNPETGTTTQGESVEEALGGPNSLDVDAVLLIIEHGDYPVNEFGQVEYPRFEMFQKIVEVFRKSGRSVPVFVDKHLSYDHRKAAQMVATAQDMKFGLMAGSSLPAGRVRARATRTASAQGHGSVFRQVEPNRYRDRGLRRIPSLGAAAAVIWP